MQTTDIVILVVIILPALVGAIYGFLNIAFSIVAWALSLGISFKFCGNFTPLLAGYVESDIIRQALAFIGLFIISLIILTALGYFIVKLLGRTGLTAADRILGFLFGVALGGAIISAVVFLAGFTPIPKEPWWRTSVLIVPFQRVAVWSQQFLPENVAKYHSYDTSGPEPGAGGT